MKRGKSQCENAANRQASNNDIIAALLKIGESLRGTDEPVSPTRGKKVFLAPAMSCKLTTGDGKSSLGQTGRDCL